MVGGGCEYPKGDSLRLHNPAPVAWRAEDVNLGALGLVVPLNQSGRNLGETVDARRDIPVQSTRDGGSTAGTGDQEHGLVAFDHRFSRSDCAQPRLALLKLCDELLAILNLKRRVRHRITMSFLALV